MISEKLPVSKAILKKIGMRGKQKWISGRNSHLKLPYKKNILMAKPDQNYMTFAMHWIGWRYHEPITTLFLIELCKKSRVFYDIGANVGYFSLVAATYNPKLKISSFEPNPKLLKILSENAVINNLPINVESFAVSDGAHKQTFFIAESDMSGSLDLSFRDVVGEVVVETTSLDEYGLDKLPDSGVLIKIDVEGHEAQVLEGGAGIISRYHPDFIMEVIEGADTNKIFANNGYSYYEIGRDGLSMAQPQPKVNSDKGYANFFVTTKNAQLVSNLNDELRAQISALTEETLDEVGCY